MCNLIISVEFILIIQDEERAPSAVMKHGKCFSCGGLGPFTTWNENAVLFAIDGIMTQRFQFM
jgi:hypothetical protein